MKNTFPTALLTLALLLQVTFAQAEAYLSGPARVTVVELFTSEGCSSCPPAEAWLARLADDPELWTRIIPLAFHVDYWDDLGWTDRYGNAAFSRRQRTYHAQGAVNAVYTPGIMVNGHEYREFFNPLTRFDSLAADESTPGVLKLMLDNEVKLTFTSQSATTLVANLAYLGINLRETIKRGENAGRVLTHPFVVLHHMTLQGQASWTFPAHEVPGQAAAVVAWVSSPDDQTPQQAVGGLLK